MKKSRWILHISAVAVLAVFIVCTFASAYMEKYMQTVVEVVTPEKIFLTIEGATSAYPVVPVSSIVKEANRSYVYVVRSSRGVFGDEYNVYEAGVGIMEENDGKAVLIGKNINLSNMIVVEPSNLADGQSVQLQGEG